MPYGISDTGPAQYALQQQGMQQESMQNLINLYMRIKQWKDQNEWRQKEWEYESGKDERDYGLRQQQVEGTIANFNADNARLLEKEAYGRERDVATDKREAEKLALDRGDKDRTYNLAKDRLSWQKTKPTTTPDSLRKAAILAADRRFLAGKKSVEMEKAKKRAEAASYNQPTTDIDAQYAQVESMLDVNHKSELESIDAQYPETGAIVPPKKNTLPPEVQAYMKINPTVTEAQALELYSKWKKGIK